MLIYAVWNYISQPSSLLNTLILNDTFKWTQFWLYYDRHIQLPFENNIINGYLNRNKLCRKCMKDANCDTAIII